MKFILILILGFCLTACSADEKPINSANKNTATNPNSVNSNQNVPNIAPQTNTANNNAVNNSPNTTANPNDKTIKLGEAVLMKPSEIIAIQGTNLRILMVITGTAAPVLNRETRETGPAVPWCRVEATLNGKTDGRQLYPDPPRNEFIFEGFKIHAQNVTATGTGSCILTVTKVEK